LFTSFFSSAMEGGFCPSNGAAGKIARATWMLVCRTTPTHWSSIASSSPVYALALVGSGFSTALSVTAATFSWQVGKVVTVAPVFLTEEPSNPS
jgi:hypothetical protein